MKIPAPRHGTVVAYLALFAAVGGSAYAVSKVDSGEIQNRSIRGKDVADDTLGGRQIKEATVAASPAVGDERSGTCDPLPGTPVDCIGKTLMLKRESGLLIIATGSKTPQPGSGSCAITVDGTESVGEFLDGSTRDGFALTKVTSLLNPGPHTVALRCREGGSNLTLDNPTIAAVAVQGDS